MLVTAAISETALAAVVAGATLLGSAVGGGITGFVTMRAERRRQEFAREQDGERRERELRMAGRLILEELDDGETKIAIAHAEGMFWLRPQDSLSTAQWNEHRGTLAGCLDDDAWTAVATAFGWLNRLNWMVLEIEAKLSPVREAYRLPIDDFAEIEAAWQSAAEAKRVLHAAGISGPATADQLDRTPPGASEGA